MSGIFSTLAALALIAFIAGMVKPGIVVFWSQQKTRGHACLYLAASVIFSIAAGGSLGGTPTAAVSDTPSASVSVSAGSAASQAAPPSKAPACTAQPKPYSATVLPGYYEIGTDLPAGTYNLDIVSGKGNVTDENDGVNLIMGTDSDEIYQKSYKNAELTEGATLFVQQCSVKATSSNPGKIKRRDNSSAKPVTLSSGKYTAGRDFQVGYYDITLVSGSGNVICRENELNAIFSTDRTFGVTTYKNVPFKDGDKLDIEGAKVKLSPSK